MCGILAILGASDPKEARKRAVELAPLYAHLSHFHTNFHSIVCGFFALMMVITFTFQ
jgi:hypothetical protein